MMHMQAAPRFFLKDTKTAVMTCQVLAGKVVREITESDGVTSICRVRRSSSESEESQRK